MGCLHRSIGGHGKQVGGFRYVLVIDNFATYFYNWQNVKKARGEYPVKDTEQFLVLREKAGFSPEQIAKITGYSLSTVCRWENNKTRPDNAVIDHIASSVVFPTDQGITITRPLTFIDLFAGIGGMRMAFESLGCRCVFTSEWNKYSRQTYLANFACDHEIAGDITHVCERDIPEHDILLAGFPCQPFSIAGVSKKNALGQSHGFDCKTQGNLFFDVARIIRYHRPKAFLLENVKNIEHHDNGRTFYIIRETIKQLGYTCEWKVIDARSWVPQHRERIFIAGFREDCGFTFDSLDIPSRDQVTELRSILHPENGSEEPEPPYTEGKEARVSAKYTLTNHLWQYLQDYAEKHRSKGNGFGFGLVGPGDTARTLSARYYKDGSEILVRQKGRNPRRLTPRECSRLMGFDEPGRAPFKIPVSDTHAYKQFGNAVVVPVVRNIAKHMLPFVIAIGKNIPCPFRGLSRGPQKPVIVNG
ncbi:MAG: DNA-cytosine methyltransferase [Deltaproteobacteria bacterium ADurb.Bin135]|nr:MAG: DNA-cytosine methyltransferase [Deltaproteobacteria bacterium ADurb.Bin135]